LIDRFDRKTALSFVYTGFVVGTILCAFAWGYYSLLIIRFLTGMFGGIIGAIVLSIVSDLFPFERRGSAMGILMAAFSAAAALGVPLGIFLADTFSWEAPFLFVGGVGILLTFLIFFRFPQMVEHLRADPTVLQTHDEILDEAPVTKVHKKSLAYVLKEIYQDRNQVNALTLGFVLVLGHFMIIPFIAPYMTRNVGFTQSQITYIYFLGGIFTVFSAPLVGKLTDRFGAKRVFAILMVLSFVPTIWITHMPVTMVAVALIATSLFFVLGSGRMIPPQAMITAAVGPSNRGSFMSVKSALQQAAIALASVVSGLMVTTSESEELIGYNYVGYLAIVICLIAIYLSRNLKVAAGN
ncbi:MAG: MFS transporter, partial [Bacteroidota bacterium]